MKRFVLVGVIAFIWASFTTFFSPSIVHALDLNWKGVFRTEINSVFNYTLDAGNVTTNATQLAANGYYIPGGGQTAAHFQNLFMRLDPSVIVNDNIYIRSQWWLGNPVFGMFGAGLPYPIDQRQFYSTQSRGAELTAHRFWVDLLSDFGTVQVGRAPLNWGLGVVWNSGDGLWDKYQSTGDMVRLASKFGSFSFTPAIVKYSMGNSIGGACLTPTVTGPCTGTEGSGGASDYSLSLLYENPDTDMELGVNFIRRIVESGQDANGFQGLTGAAGGAIYNTWDLYGRKRIGQLTVAAEAPIASGTISGFNYTSFAIAGEAKWEPSDAWEFGLKAGLAPGQGGANSATPASATPFYYHPNYRLGMIMFGYQFRNFSGPASLNNATTPGNNLLSPYDNPITNALYAALSGSYRMSKWKLHASFVLATAQQVATSSTTFFFNSWTRKFVSYAASANQSNFLGWEVDWGATFKWDDNFLFGVDMGLFVPGSYYKFSNTATENTTQTAFATSVKLGVTF